MAESLLIGKGQRPLNLLANLANRHGLIAGATGTGKTVSLRVMAEQFSRIGVPVFMADVKGDLSGMAQAGEASDRIKQRIEKLELADWKGEGFPVTFWDVFGEQGHPVRATISDMGPMLLGRLLNLNETQSGVLTLVFKYADDNGLLLLDLKDLRATLQHVSDNSKQIKAQYGNVSAASVGAIQRALLELEQQGAEQLFGEPALDIDDLMQTDRDGRGVINILVADKLLHTPKIYATLLLWLISELFERLPEVGDPEKPKVVFFFDEAHLLFDDAPKALLDKIEQLVRLIRSKGVGIYFVTQSPTDVPDEVLGQLGNRVQHALRAFTPKDQKAVRTAAQTFRANRYLDVETAITELGVGEALVSFLDPNGSPEPVERALIVPPHSRLTPLTPDERKAVVQNSIVAGAYEKAVDRESAYELLRQRVESAPQPAEAQAAPAQREPAPARREERSDVMDVAGKIATSAARAMASQAGRSLMRGLLGSLLGGTTTRRRRY